MHDFTSRKTTEPDSAASYNTYLTNFVAAMAMMNQDVSMIDVGSLNTAPSNVALSINWTTRQTALTFTYQHEQDVATSSVSGCSASIVPYVESVRASPPAATKGAAGPSISVDSQSQGACGSPKACPPKLPRRATMLEYVNASKPAAMESQPDGRSEDATQGENVSDQPSASAPGTASGSAPSTSNAPAAAANQDADDAEPIVPPPGASAPSASVKSEKAVKNEKARAIYHPDRQSQKIRNSDPAEYTDWFASESEKPLREPPKNLRVWHGMLYVHWSWREERTRIWMYFEPHYKPGTRVRRRCAAAGGWQRVRKGHEHPYLDGYVLHLVDSGEPRWVKRGTAMNYAKQSRLRREAALL